MSFRKFLSLAVGIRVSAIAAFGLLLFLCTLEPAFAQSVSKEDRERGQKMLKVVRDDLKDKYYDATFRGLDLDARFKQAAEKIEQAASVGQINGIIAQVLIDLNDSHTFFIPPPWSFQVEYGWEMQSIGDKCFVVSVDRDSDAAAQGLRPGDEVYSVEGIWPTRENLWKLKYMYQTLRPKTRLKVVIQKPDGQQQQLEIAAQVTPGLAKLSLADFIINELIEEIGDINSYPRYVEVDKDVVVWKIPEFDLSEKAVDGLMKKVQGRKSLVLDLRGNPGGYVIALQRLAGYFFDKEVKIADLKRRKETKELKAKPRGKDRLFTGKLVVIVDSESGSAAEVFARLVQIEKRGTVIGDRTSGKVMRSRVYQHETGPLNKLVFFALSVTDADLIMSDGKSLEGMGVVPDEVLLPTPVDMATGRDPVMARAASLAGVTIEPEKAAFFPRLKRITRIDIEQALEQKYKNGKDQDKKTDKQKDEKSAPSLPKP